ncbi:MAG TPA: MgtC/SapB family protein, partial [Rhizomicrobium sp.]|nr:MgtC/SapB family protein [Rhizomicrobium sp.]
MDLELLQRASLAAAIGLLIGIERGWQERQARDGARVAGIRTYTLIGILGGIAGLLAGDITLGLCLLGFALPFGYFEWQRASQSGTVSVTGFIAGLVTFALGAYATRGNMAVAAAGGVVTAAVLAERKLLHGFLRRLTWIELRAAILLLVMTVVLLPILPDRTVDPWNALNPHQLWLMTVLVGIVSYAGYIAVHVAGARRGLLFAGLAGGVA